MFILYFIFVVLITTSDCKGNNNIPIMQVISDKKLIFNIY